MFYKIVLLILTTSIMMGCAATDKRLLGDPSISVALYVNQIFIARKICSQDKDYVDKSMADRFYDYTYRGTGAPGYIEYHPEFKLYFNEIQKKYIDSSENMSESKKVIFCDLFNADLIAMKNIGVIKTIEKQIAIKNYFSPAHEAPEDLKKIGFLTILAVGFIPTAVGISEVNKGNFSTAGKMFDHSTNISNAIGSSTNINSTKYCAAFNVFEKFKNIDDQFSWNDYFSIMNC